MGKRSNGMTRGDANRNARLGALRAVLPRDHAILGIDLAQSRQAAALVDHDSRVLALVEMLGDGAGTVAAHGVEVEDLFDGGYLGLDRPQVLGLGVDLQSLGRDTERPLALAGLALDAVDDPIDDLTPVFFLPYGSPGSPEGVPARVHRER